MVIQLGVAAGEILTVFEDDRQPRDIEDLVALSDYPREIVLMAIGWLVREGYIKLEEKDGRFWASMNKKRP